MADGEDNLPKDAKMIKTLLASMGVHEYEPRVVRQFLELFYRNAVDLLMDAKTYSNHAGKSCIDSADVNLAIQSKAYFSFTDPPLPEVTIAAKKRSKWKIPRLVTGGVGTSLPPEQETLIVSNYYQQLQSQKNQSSKVVEEEEEDIDQGTNLPPNPGSFPKAAQEQKSKWLGNSRQRVSFPLGQKTLR
ncbi:hypothetical protein OSB04_027499 [Centaurea solstitialis]|uniref:Transcription initiation factor TFIID subunit 9 n=1 Tax=Centaurea solstitialis TaxID=347529 RepID=A0AA38SLD3_9ASTR|nr:hypothetical protein OSB04_027499 [Centaurea solstitialis]